MIGVFVSEGHGMHDADSRANELKSQFGRRVDQQVSLGQPKNGRAAGAEIPFVVPGADGARASDHGDSDRCARS